MKEDPKMIERKLEDTLKEIERVGLEKKLAEDKIAILGDQISRLAESEELKTQAELQLDQGQKMLKQERSQNLRLKGGIADMKKASRRAQETLEEERRQCVRLKGKIADMEEAALHAQKKLEEERRKFLKMKEKLEEMEVSKNLAESSAVTLSKEASQRSKSYKAKEGVLKCQMGSYKSAFEREVIKINELQKSLEKEKQKTFLVSVLAIALFAIAVFAARSWALNRIFNNPKHQ